MDTQVKDAQAEQVDAPEQEKTDVAPNVGDAFATSLLSTKNRNKLVKHMTDASVEFLTTAGHFVKTDEESAAAKGIAERLATFLDNESKAMREKLGDDSARNAVEGAMCFVGASVSSFNAALEADKNDAKPKPEPDPERSRILEAVHKATREAGGKVAPIQEAAFMQNIQLNPGLTPDGKRAASMMADGFMQAIQQVTNTVLLEHMPNSEAGNLAAILDAALTTAHRMAKAAIGESATLFKKFMDDGVFGAGGHDSPPHAKPAAAIEESKAALN